MAKDTLAQRFSRDDAKRQGLLQEARHAAALTKPWVCPPANHPPSKPLPDAFQSIGPRGITSIGGRTLTALFPPHTPWFAMQLDPTIEHDPDVPDEAKHEIKQRLWLRELMIQGVLESSQLRRRPRRIAGFRNHKRAVLDQLYITGDVLETLTEDFRMKSFRRDQYVTRRDSAGDVLYHITKENLDALSLDEDRIRRAELNPADLKDQDVHKRMVDLHTLVEWQPQAENWVIRQEVNGNTITESQEPVTPYFATAFELVSGEDYGRGFAMLNKGDLSSVDNLRERLLDFAAMASKQHPVVDPASHLRPSDMEQPSGTVLVDNVQNGVPTRIGLLRAERLNDFRVVFETAQHIEKELSEAMLLESEIQPQKERVTATQIQRIAQELEGALGGLYAPIADQQQLPLLQRTIYQLQRDNLMPALPDDTVRVEVLTGVAALSREISANRLMNFVEVANALGETARRRIDDGVLLDVMARYQNVREKGLIKSEEQVQQEMAAERQQALQDQAAAKAVDTAGNVAETAAENATEPEPRT